MSHVYNYLQTFELTLQCEEKYEDELFATEEDNISEVTFPCSFCLYSERLCDFVFIVREKCINIAYFPSAIFKK